MSRVAVCAVLCLLGMGLAGPGSAAEYRVPLMPQAPKIDGLIEPAEWAVSVGFSGFAWDGLLDRRRIEAFVGATERHIYVAFKSQLPDEGELVAQVNLDSEKIVFDDSVEVWIDPTPGSEHGRIFQMLTNSLGRQGYVTHARGNVQADPAWRGNWKEANGFHDGYWHCEIEIPVETIAPGRRADEGRWAINLCRNWKEPWSFSSLGGRGYAPQDLVFTFSRADALAIAHETRGDPFVGDLDMSLRLANPTTELIQVQAAMLLTRDVMPELKAGETFTLAPGETKTLSLAARDDATRKYDLMLSVTSPDGAKTYYSRAVGWKRGEPWRWVAVRKEVLPIDFQFGYYPYLNKMRILADVTNLPPEARLDRLTCEIRRRGGQVVKTVALDKFVNGRQEIAFDLPPLEGEYEIAMKAWGENVPAGELVKPFERRVFEWEHLGLGAKEKVYPPFIPIRVVGAKVSTVLREHTMNAQGLWEQVVAKGKPLLAAPMHYSAVVDGAPAQLKAGPLKFTRISGYRSVAQTSISAGALRGQATCTWDYDGLMRVDLTLQPTGGKTVDALTLEIPLKNAAATMMHAMGDGIRNTIYQYVPEGQGVVWTAEKVAVNDLPRNFCSYIFLGTPVRGLSWFAENDRGWSWDPSKPNLELERKGDVLTLRVHLVNKPITITQPRTITFGLLAAPVKPRLEPWRHRWRRDNYSLLGTDINWFALGNCGSVYPAGKDMYLWEMLRRGNREQLTDADIEAVIERGRKYYEPYGDWLDAFIAHVRYNLRARYGTKMVFYYNRASYQACEEFQTFQDEWCLDDYRTVGPGNGIWEIKVVPSDSYIDYNLYWYGKSFDIAGNQGVYWDNWFFVGSYNRMMTSAYRCEDGTIRPSTGLWGLRELSKRTFQYMNERGMLPITMPHMTSTNILPLHSFATVQYDWEWKYSEGDVQYRFPREYILLVSNGELAGTWPVLLNDHGPQAEDPWVSRTFAAVAMVHELDCPYPAWSPAGQAQLALFKPVDEIISQPGYEAYRYWDERPQPAVADSRDLPTIVYALKGRQAVVAVVSYAEEDMQATLAIDPVELGFTKGYRVEDIETGEVMKVNVGAGAGGADASNRRDLMPFSIKKHDIRLFRIMPARGN